MGEKIEGERKLVVEALAIIQGEKEGGFRQSHHIEQQRKVEGFR